MNAASDEATSKGVEADDEQEGEETAEDKSDDDKAEEAEPAEVEESELEKLRREFTATKSKYERDLKAYEEFQSKVKSTREKAEELNQRFAKWYYAISGDSYDKLAIDRSSFVSIKKVQEEDEDAEESDDSEAETAEESK